MWLILVEVWRLLLRLIRVIADEVVRALKRTSASDIRSDGGLLLMKTILYTFDILQDALIGTMCYGMICDALVTMWHRSTWV